MAVRNPDPVPRTRRLLAKMQATIRKQENGWSTRFLRNQKSAVEHLLANLEDVSKTIEKAKASGQTIEPWWLMRQARYTNMLDQYVAALKSNVNELSKSAAPFGETGGYLQNMRDDLLADLKGHLPRPEVGGTMEVQINQSFAQLDIHAIVGQQEAQRQVWVEAWFDQLADEVREELNGALIRGLVTGDPVATVAKDVAKVTNMSSTRALTIARTETMRAHREALRQIYTDLSAVDGWEWMATGDERTCLICFSLDGKVFYQSGYNDTSLPTMDTHPNCRCTMLPHILFNDELEIPDQGYQGPSRARNSRWTGEGQWDLLTEDEKLKLVGPARYKALKDGDIQFSDLIEPKNYLADPDLPRDYRIRTLKELGIDDPGVIDDEVLTWQKRIDQLDDEMQGIAEDAIEKSVYSSGTQIGGRTLAPDNPEDVAKAFRHYNSQDGFFRINASGRGITTTRHGGSLRIDDEILEETRLIDRTIADEIPFDEDFLAWRGIPDRGRHANAWRNARVGDTLTDGGFVSTSIEKNASNYFMEGSGGYRFRILIPKGSRGSYVSARKRVQGMELDFDRDIENELLLARGSRFKVLRRVGHEITLVLLPS